MAKAPVWEPPPDPDFEKLAHEGYRMWEEDSPGAISFDTETTGLTYFDTAFCVTVAWSRPSTGEIVGHYFELEKFRSHRMVWDILNKTPVLVGHNLKFDLQKARLAGLLTRSLEPASLEDTQILAHLLDEYRPKGLKDLMVSVLGWQDTMQVEVKGKDGPYMKEVVREKYEIQKARTKLKLKKEDGYHLIPRGIVAPYAITDAVGTHGLVKALRPRVQRHADMWELYRQELELTCVLLAMEDAGLGVIPDYVDERVKEYAKKVLMHEMRIQEITGRKVGKKPASGVCGVCGHKRNDCTCFNPASSDQLKEAFSALGYDRPNYDKKQLKTIDHPLAQTIIEYRKDSKLLSTYFLAIRNEQRDEVLHPSFNQNVSTGRMSSGGAKED